MLFGIPSETWLPIATLFIGFMTTSVLELFRHRWTTVREREARKEEQKEARRLRRIEFQRQSVVELQEAAVGFFGAALKTSVEHREDVVVVRDFMRETVTSLWVPAMRVHDETVRDLVLKMRDKAFKAVQERDEHGREQARGEAATAFGERQAELGRVLRSLDGYEEETVH